MGIERIEYKGKQILCVSYVGLKSQDEIMEVLRESSRIVSESSNFLIYSDLTGASLGPDFMKEAKETGKELVNNVDKAAVTGVTGLKKILMKGYNMFIDNDKVTQVFDSKEEALDYLVS